jgi:3-hydroxy-9,10-secoandrosta-1,3,5(10)-triene-9,17-dione monooxygenase
MPTAPTETARELLERAIALQPRLRERAAQARELRRVPEQTITDFKEAGFFRMLQPRRYGGFEMHPQHFYDVVFELSRACPSSGWVLSVVGVHNWQLGLLDDRAQREVWGQDDSTLISSSYAPKGKALPVEGGFNFSGRWQFSSGCDHCDWIFVGGLLPGADDTPMLASFLIPRSDYRIEDDWYTTGLQGSGSKSLVVDSTFVPEYRVHSFLQGYLCQSPGQAVNPAALYRLPFGQVFIRAVSMPAVGAAQGALDAYCAYNRKRLNSVGMKVVGAPAGQLAAARARSTIRTAQLKMHHAYDTLLDCAERGEAFNLQDRAEFRYDACDAVDQSVQAAQALLANSGGSAIYNGNTVNAFYQDLLAFRQHAANQPETPATNLGATLFGLPAQDPFS